MLSTLFVSRGVKLLYLPPYSPDLNSIEESFLFIKVHIQQHGPQFHDCVSSMETHHLLMFLYKVLDQIMPTHAKGWMKDSGYMYTSALHTAATHPCLSDTKKQK